MKKGTTYFEEHGEELLAKAGMTKAAFAKSMGASPQNVAKLFTSNNVFVLQAASEILKVPVSTLIDGIGNEPTIQGCIFLNGVPYTIGSKADIEMLLEKLG